MGVKRGLSVDGIMYFSDLLESKKEPDWMEFGVQIGKLSGHYEIIDFLTGYKNMDQFLFRTPKWPIGGMYFDGIMRTEHVSRIRPTEYPVQTGATMTDHALVEPAEVTIEIMMTDAKASSYMQNPMLPQGLPINPPIFDHCWPDLGGAPDMLTMAKDGRSARAWMNLRKLQVQRIPITVETRLQTYHNMLIEELSAPDDVMTLHALRCTVRLREIIFAQVAQTETSARASASAEETSSGQTPVQTGGGVDKTAASAIQDAVGGIFA